MDNIIFQVNANGAAYLQKFAFFDAQRIGVAGEDGRLGQIFIGEESLAVVSIGPKFIK
jgi:hypothetical protein